MGTSTFIGPCSEKPFAIIMSHRPMSFNLLWPYYLDKVKESFCFCTSGWSAIYSCALVLIFSEWSCSLHISVKVSTSGLRRWLKSISVFTEPWRDDICLIKFDFFFNSTQISPQLWASLWSHSLDSHLKHAPVKCNSSFIGRCRCDMEILRNRLAGNLSW